MCMDNFRNRMIITSYFYLNRSHNDHINPHINETSIDGRSAPILATLSGMVLLGRMSLY